MRNRALAEAHAFRERKTMAKRTARIGWRTSGYTFVLLVGLVASSCATSASSEHRSGHTTMTTTSMPRVVNLDRASTAKPRPSVDTSRQRLAVLQSSHEAFSSPTSGARLIATISAKRPLTGERTTLPILAMATAQHEQWLEVLLPGRPNGHSGWIRKRATSITTTDWKVVVHLTSRTMAIERANSVVRIVAVVIGAPTTPTPLGEFFVEEVLLLDHSAVGAPFAFALSARSNVFQEFAGGPGQVAIHGLENIGGIPGTAASHGCVRVDRATLDWMVTRLAPGTPVTIEN